MRPWDIRWTFIVFMQLTGTTAETLVRPGEFDLAGILARRERPLLVRVGLVTRPPGVRKEDRATYTWTGLPSVRAPSLLSMQRLLPENLMM